MYLKKLNDQILLVIIAIVLSAFVDYIEALSPHQNPDSHKNQQTCTRYFFEVFKQKQEVRARTATTQKNRTTTSNAVTQSSHIKKWQVGRVSRRQYEIINMLWRKTKEFPDVEMSTSSYHPEYPLYKLPSRTHSTTTSTPSFIEFYYLDENDERIRDSIRKHQFAKEARVGNLKNSDILIADYPIFAFRINSRNRERFPSMPVSQNIKTTYKIKTISASIVGLLNSVTFQKINKNISNGRTQEAKLSAAAKLKLIKNSKATVTEPLYVIDHETCPASTKDFIKLDKETTNKHLDSYSSIAIYRNFPKSTTVYDKIKFFEMYDKHTPLPYYKEEENSVDLDDAETGVNGNKLNNDQRILLEHVDQSFGNQHSKRHKQSHAKKHIVENNKSYSNEFITEIITLKPTQAFNISKENKNNKLLMNESLSSKTKVPMMAENIINKVAEWADYSFMAVYIYEPSQVQCDAAGISPHWLVTSGSCLSRHHKNPSGEGRSAFVAYCGSSWWTAERIAYVKYSVVHPHYHQRDNSRRYMYNIGLVQVVISLTTCPGWAPISLMSHQFVADPGGSKAYAVGWGLDRYDTRYSSADLPKYPLMVYESRVFSDSCPGSSSYTEVKREAEDDAFHNLYCLSLPPYSGEDTDPIHGSMLVVGGKLCAIYLQEERRSSGEQSAEYTGTWQLGPWVSHVAREPDDGEPFTFVI